MAQLAIGLDIQELLAGIQEAKAELSSLADAARNAADAVSGIAESSQEVGQAEEGPKKFSASISSVYYAAQLAVSGIQAVASSVEQFIAIGEEAAGGVDIARSFELLASQAGVSADELLANMRRASRGTVSEVELMRSANRALLAGGADIASELPRLFEIARAAAIATGQDVSRVYETLVTGIVKGSPQLIDNAEIYLSLGDALDTYAASLGKSTDELTRQERMQATLNAVLEQGARYTEMVGSEAGQASDAFIAYHTAVQELRQELGERLLPTTTRVAQALADLARTAGGGFAEDYSVELHKALQDTDDFLATVRHAAEQVGQHPSLTGGWKTLMQAIADTTDSYDEYREGVQAALAVLERNVSYLELADAQASVLSREEYEAARALRERAAASEQAAQSARQQIVQEQQLADVEARVTDSAQRLAQVQQSIAEEVADIKAEAARRAADEASRQAQREQQAAIQAARQIEDAMRRAEQRRVAIAQQYSDAIAQAQVQYHKTVQSAQASHAQQMESIERAYRRRLAEIEADYEQSEEEAIQNRDALALERARKQRERDIAEAEQSHSEQVSRAQESYRQQLSEARAAYQQQIAAARQARARQEEELRQSLERMRQEQAIAARRRQEDAAREEAYKQAQLQQWIAREIEAVRNKHAQELREAQVYHQRMLAEQARYIAAMSRLAVRYPSVRPQAGVVPGMASGGYATSGVYQLGEEGREFVLDASTTRLMESMAGRLSQDKVRALAVQRGGPSKVSVQQNFTFAPGISASDREWIRQETYNSAVSAVREVLGD